MILDEALAAISPYAMYFSRSVDEVATDLIAYSDLLNKWQMAQNLVSRETLKTLWSRHIADSLQVLKLLRPCDRRFLDLGSGGGLPSIPMAIARRGNRDSTFLLVEPNGRKASFLRTVARELELQVRVEGKRAEEIDSRETIRPDVVTSRALAPLPALFQLITPYLTPNSRAILHKGREYVEELAESRALWQFDVVVVPSDTSPDSALLDVSNLRMKTVS